MRKVYKKLTAEQVKRGVIFSSVLKGNLSECLHEVMDTDSDKNEQIARLLNDSFFNGSPYTHNEVRR
jgi:hypothetical protein